MSTIWSGKPSEEKRLYTAKKNWIIGCSISRAFNWVTISRLKTQEELFQKWQNQVLIRNSFRTVHLHGSESGVHSITEHILRHQFTLRIIPPYKPKSRNSTLTQGKEDHLHSSPNPTRPSYWRSTAKTAPNTWETKRSACATVPTRRSTRRTA
jgi:hypothetical protein